MVVVVDYSAAVPTLSTSIRARLTPHRLQHKFEVELKDGTRQTRLSTLCEYGSTDPSGYSAMAKLGENPQWNELLLWLI